MIFDVMHENTIINSLSAKWYGLCTCCNVVSAIKHGLLKPLKMCVADILLQKKNEKLFFYVKKLSVFDCHVVYFMFMLEER